MTALRIAAALTAALAAAPAAAYVRTRGSTGVELAWRVPIVAWTLNRDWPNTSPSCTATGAGDPTLDAARSGFAAWEQPCAELQLLYAGTIPEIRVGTVGSTENLVVFREGWCSNRLPPDEPCYLDWDVDCGGIYNCFEDHTSGCPNPPCADKSVVALTSVLYDPATGRIFDADIEINGWDGTAGPLTGTQPQHGWYFTCYEPATAQPATPCAAYGDPDCHFIDLRNTVTHEVGHFVGLAHAPPHDVGDPPESWATMEAKTNVGDTWMRSLSGDDVAGVCAIYPSADGGCGCGSGGAGGMLALLLAAAALRRRRP